MRPLLKLITEQYNDKKFCRRPSCKKNLMTLEIEFNWHKCSICKDVQSVSTKIPLCWVKCPKCQWPELAKQDDEFHRFICKKCKHPFIIKTGKHHR